MFPFPLASLFVRIFAFWKYDYENDGIRITLRENVINMMKLILGGISGQ